MKIWIWKKQKQLCAQSQMKDFDFRFRVIVVVSHIILLRLKNCHIFTWYWNWAVHQMVYWIPNSQVPNFMNFWLIETSLVGIKFIYSEKTQIFLKHSSNILGRLFHIFVILSEYFLNNLICWKSVKIQNSGFRICRTMWWAAWNSNVVLLCYCCCES